MPEPRDGLQRSQGTRPRRLHGIFVDPFSAFDNAATERLLHLRVASEALILGPMRRGSLVVRVIHGWENGSFEPAALCHSDHRPGSLEALRQVADDFRQAFERQQPLSRDTTSLLAAPSSGPSPPPRQVARRSTRRPAPSPPAGPPSSRA